jgi:hypothetical protein
MPWPCWAAPPHIKYGTRCARCIAARCSGPAQWPRHGCAGCLCIECAPAGSGAKPGGGVGLGFKVVDQFGSFRTPGYLDGENEEEGGRNTWRGVSAAKAARLTAAAGVAVDVHLDPQEHHVTAVLPFDAGCFGGDRSAVLRRSFGHAEQPILVVATRGVKQAIVNFMAARGVKQGTDCEQQQQQQQTVEVCGYLFSSVQRTGPQTWGRVIGPVCAVTPEVALALVAVLGARPGMRASGLRLTARIGQAQFIAGLCDGGQEEDEEDDGLDGLGFQPPPPDDGQSSMGLNDGMLIHADAYPGRRATYFAIHERGSG